MVRTALVVVFAALGFSDCLASRVPGVAEIRSLDADALGKTARQFCAPRNLVANEQECRAFIKLLENIELDPRRLKEAQLVLAEVYGDLAMSAADERERAHARRQQYAIYEALLADSPDDVEILKHYAYAHEDDDATAALLRRALGINPHDATAHWILALTLLSRGDEGSMLEGLDHFRSAYNYAEGAFKLQMAANFYVRLGSNGFGEEAERFKRQLQNDLQARERMRKAEEAIKSNMEVNDAALAVHDLVGTFCHSQYLLVEQETCSHALVLIDDLQQRAPHSAAVLAMAVDAHRRVLTGRATPDQHPENILLQMSDELLDTESRSVDLPVLRKIVSDNPTAHPAVRASFAEALDHAGEPAEAIRQLRHAFDVSRTDEHKRIYGERLIELLQEEGRDDEARRIICQLRRLKCATAVRGG